MAEKLRLGCDVRELKIGASFLNDKSSAFHTLKCDFKPASVDASKMATVDVGTNNQVTVTVPHLDGAGVPQTVFKGNQRPYHKECVLIIDRITGEMTLEKLSTNIQVKKTRQEPVHKIAPPPNRPPADTSANNCTQRSSSRTRVTTSGRRPAPVPASCTPPPPRHRSEIPQAAPWTVNSGQSTLASLPMIGLMEDDMTQPSGGHPVHIPLSIPPPLNGHSMETPNTPKTRETEEVGVLSSSSGSSSSGSESEHSDSGGSESEAETNHPPPPNHSKPTINGGMNGSTLNNAEASMPMHLLNDDLCLSESGSDSD